MKTPVFLSLAMLGQAAVFEAGKPLPELVLPSLEDGRPASLQQFRGKKLLLHIFASW